MAEEREVVDDAITGESIRRGVLAWDRLQPDARVESPAIVEGTGTTVVIPPGASAAVDAWRNVVLTPPAAGGVDGRRRRRRRPRRRPMVPARR